MNISVQAGFTHFFAAARLVAYAIATACLTGLPAFTSVLMFSLNALGEADFLSIYAPIQDPDIVALLETIVRAFSVYSRCATG